MKYSTEEIGKKIKSERLSRKWSQEQLGQKIGTTYKQISNYENGKLIPPMDILLKLCDIFNCELGYILGEDEYNAGTKLDTIIEHSLGLNTSSTKALQYITGKNRNCLNFGYESNTYRQILNNLLCDPAFSHLLESLYELDSCIKHKERMFVELEKKYGKEVLATAFECYNSTTDYLCDQNAKKLDDIYYEAMIDIETFLSKEYDISFSIKINRYNVRESFERLIDSLYPNKNI